MREAEQYFMSGNGPCTPQDVIGGTNKWKARLLERFLPIDLSHAKKACEAYGLLLLV